MQEVRFELRELNSSDVFYMLRILGKIGFKDLKSKFSPDKIKEIMDSLKGDEHDKSEEDENEKAKNKNEAITLIGMTIVTDLLEVIVTNLPLCEREIYNFLGALSGMTPKEVAKLPMVVFTQLIIDVLQKDEFKDFFKLASNLFK